MKWPLNFLLANTCRISSPDAFMSFTTSPPLPIAHILDQPAKKDDHRIVLFIPSIAASKMPGCHPTKLTVGDVHGDFETKTQVSCGRGSPVHCHLQQGLV